jgi:hypothetical protein
MSTYFNPDYGTAGLVNTSMKPFTTTLLETFLGLAEEFLSHLKAGGLEPKKTDLKSEIWLVKQLSKIRNRWASTNQVSVTISTV